MNHQKIFLMLFAALLLFLFTAGRFYSKHDREQQRILLSHSFGQSHPIHQFLVNLNHELDAKSGGKMKLVIYDSAQLGAEPQFTEQIRTGILDGGVVSNQMLTKFSPDFVFLQYPYMFRNEAETRRFLNTFAEKELSESLRRSNCNLLLCCSLTNGMNGFYFTGSPEGFRLSKRGKTTCLASSVSPFCMKCFSGIGFLAVPVAKGEIYSALQMKMLNAGENTLPGLISSKHYETAKFFVTTNHSPAVFYLVFNTGFMEKLSSQEKKWLKESFVEAKGKYENMKTPDLEKLAQKNGVTCLSLSEQEKDFLRERAATELKKAAGVPWRNIFCSERKRMEELQ